MSGEIHISDIVRDTYDQAMKGLAKYEKPLGVAKDWARCRDYTQQPTAPAEVAYKSEISEAAYRNTGADSGFDQEHIERDMPRSIIRANRTTYKDGLALFFPATALKAYMQPRLVRYAFPSETQEDFASFESNLVATLPRTSAAAKLKPEDKGDLALEEGRYSFRRSLENDFTDDSDLNIDIDDPARRKRINRKILTNQELHNAYVYSLHNPELWLGFTLWKKTVGRYAAEMLALHKEKMGEQYTARTGEKAHKDGSPDFFESRQRKFFTSVDMSVNVLTFEVFCIPHILGLTQKTRGTVENLTASDIEAGILLTKDNGAFHRTFETPHGNRTVMCPFAELALPWLTMDISRNKTKVAPSLDLCCRKIADERRESYVDLYRNMLHRVLTTVITESNAGRTKTVAAPIVQSHGPAHPQNDNKQPAGESLLHRTCG
jgi:hypothetical protein